MGIFGWFDKKDVMIVEETVVADTVSNYEFDKAYNDLAVLIQDLTALVHDNKTHTDKIFSQIDQFVGITNTRLDLIQKIVEENKSGDVVTVEMLNTVVETLASSLKQEVDDLMKLRTAIIDPAPVSQGPPIGWMNALRDEVMQQSQSARMEMKSYVDDCITAYDVIAYEAVNT